MTLIGMGYTAKYIPCRPVVISGRYSRTPCTQPEVVRRSAFSDTSGYQTDQLLKSQSEYRSGSDCADAQADP